MCTWMQRRRLFHLAKSSRVHARVTATLEQQKKKRKEKKKRLIQVNSKLFMVAIYVKKLLCYFQKQNLCN